MPKPTVSFEEFVEVFERLEHEGIVDPGIHRCIRALGHGSTALIARYKAELLGRRRGATLPGTDRVIVDPITTLAANLWTDLLHEVDRREKELAAEAVQKIEEAEGARKAAEATLERGTRENAQLQTQVADLEVSLIRSRQDAEANATLLRTAERTLEERQARLASLEGVLGSLRTELDTVLRQHAESSSRERDLIERTARLEQQLQDAAQRLADATTARKTAEEQSDRLLRETQARHEGELATLREARDAAAKAAAKAETASAALERGLQSSQQHARQLQEKVDALSAQLLTSENRVVELTNELRSAERARADAERDSAAMRNAADMLVRNLRAVLDMEDETSIKKAQNLIGEWQNQK